MTEGERALLLGHTQYVIEKMTEIRHQLVIEGEPNPDKVRQSARDAWTQVQQLLTDVNKIRYTNMEEPDAPQPRDV